MDVKIEEISSKINREDNKSTESKTCRAAWQVKMTTLHYSYDALHITNDLYSSFFSSKLIRPLFQVFVACVASLHSFGSFAAIIGSIIAKLKDESSPTHMTVEEETWFGKQKKITFNQQ